MSELAERSGVSGGHDQALPARGAARRGGAVRTSRNMAYYPPEFVERIRLIKRLQEERFMPLRVIKGVIDEDPERARALVELEDRILERALQRAGAGRVSRGRGPRRYDDPGQRARPPGGARRADARTRAATTPTTWRSSRRSSRFRAGGYDEALGFTVYDTLRYREALEPLVEEEVRTLLDRLAGEVDGRPRRGDHRRGRRAAARADRRHALQAAAGRAAPPARRRPALSRTRVPMSR